MATAAPVKRKGGKHETNGHPEGVAESGRKHLGGTGSPDFSKIPPAGPNGHQFHDIPGELLQINPEDILPSPTNPRRTFDKTKLEAMGDGFKRVGILSPIIVRKAPFGAERTYELIAGERRWRAACHVFMKAIPARVVEVTDEEALEIQAAENLEREELNPIERAEQFKILIEQGGYTQERLGDRFEISQGEISNSIRLLKLPEYWQQLVASGNLTPTHVRTLLNWLEYPQVVEKTEEAYKLSLKEDPDHPLTSDEFAERVEQAVWECSRDMAQNDWIAESRQFKTTPAIEKELDVKEVKRDWGGVAKRAMNVALWDKLQAEAIEKKKKRASSKIEKEEGGSSEESAAERKAKAKKLAEQFGKRLYRWKLTWLQKICAERLDKAPADTILRWLLFYTVQWEARGREDSFEAACKQFGCKGAKDLAKLKGEQLDRIARTSLKAWVQHAIDNYHAGIRPEDVERLVVELGIDAAKEWKLSQDFLELHTRSQLIDLVKDIAPKLSIPESANRKNAISLILKEAGNKCPAEVLKCKAVRLS